MADERGDSSAGDGAMRSRKVGKEVIGLIPGATVLLLAALFLRLWYIARVSLAGDEAVFGLMSIAIGRGEEYPLYCWGAHYASALISYIAIPVMAIMGVTSFAFKSATLPWTIGLVLLAYAHGVRRDGRIPGFLSALFLAIPLPTFLLFSVAAHGGYPETYFLGFAIWVAALGAVEKPGVARFALLGFLCGLSFAILWLGVPFIVSAVALIAWKRRVTIRCAAAGILAAGIGSLPFWIYNLAIAPGATIKRLGARSFEANAATGFADAVAGRILKTGSWAAESSEGLLNLFHPFGAGVGALEILAPWVMLAAIILGAIRLHRRADDRGTLVLFFLVSLLLFNFAGNLTRDRQWSTLLPALVIAWHGWPKRILISAACVFILIAAAADTRFVSATHPSPVIGPAVKILDERNVDAVVADYDHAYAIAFGCRGRALASGAAPPNPGDRRPDWTARIPDARRPAFLLPDDDALRDFETRMLNSGIRYERRVIANRVLVLPHAEPGLEAAPPPTSLSAAGGALGAACWPHFAATYPGIALSR
jgi:hypothetical protein